MCSWFSFAALHKPCALKGLDVSGILCILFTFSLSPVVKERGGGHFGKPAALKYRKNCLSKSHSLGNCYVYLRVTVLRTYDQVLTYNPVSERNEH